MTRWLAALALAAAVAAPAAAAPERDLLVRPGVGIGKIRLGMSAAQVRAALGRPDIEESERRGFGYRYVERTWFSGRADSFMVGLFGRDGALRVVLVSTDKVAEKTPAGIGPGVSMKRVKRTYRGLRCRLIEPPGGGFVKSELVLPHRSGNETVFVSGGWIGHTGTPHEGRYSAENLAVITVRTRSARPQGRVLSC